MEITRFTKVAFAAACLLIIPAGANGDDETYVRIDEQGAYHFTDAPSSGEYVRDPGPSGPGSEPKAAGRYEDIIRDISRKTGVRPELVKAVIRVESAFNPAAVSPKGARGLMQLMPVQSRAYDIRDPFDPEENISAGTRHLEKLIRRYDGNLNLSLAAYNAGARAVDHYNGIPPYMETRQYVQKVLLHYKKYRKKSE
ncbi:MAG: lytic transglycosylase domain-containing protein [Desulfobacterales bacterium]